MVNTALPPAPAGSIARNTDTDLILQREGSGAIIRLFGIPKPPRSEAWV